MNASKSFQQLEGLYTLDQIQKELNIARQTALNLISRYKKQGYITTKGNKPKIYRISKKKQRPGTGLFKTINKYSKIKIRPTFIHRHYGTPYTIETAIIDALKIKTPRIMIALLSLFKRINNWSELYQKAKKEDLLNLLGAMYDTSRLMQRTPEMDKRTFNALIKNKQKYKTIKEIEKKWNVELGFNENDLIQ